MVSRVEKDSQMQQMPRKQSSMLGLPSQERQRRPSLKRMGKRME
jgi:hypothetical protein